MDWSVVFDIVMVILHGPIIDCVNISILIVLTLYMNAPIIPLSVFHFDCSSIVPKSIYWTIC